MAFLGKKLAISIPDTIMEEKESPREKTAKLGTIARACAIYGVDIIEVFRDDRGRGEGPLVRRVLEYLETPQYLRRRLYPLDESLKYAGILPPLRIPSHKAKVSLDRVGVGDIREGVANDDGTIDIGLDVNARLAEKVSAGKRVTAKIVTVRPLAAALATREEAGEYWGYNVEEKACAGVLDDKRFEIKIATSRLGQPLGSVVESLAGAIKRATGVKLIFGSPSRGLYQIFGQKLVDEVDFSVNLFPEQHVETVRTEEAIFAGLALVGVASVGKA
ncbi:MAG: methylase [Nitrososphaerota archaeon]|jgi:predicted SPOUT superfamily RNA methylase MTH1|nr:methylase [Nitrososphaerota archaeon]MDG6942818.1 methylase [Nitrososphaerota archaeon]MDG6950862.1 methylase [Nitrososphaerota archaeon]